MQIDSRQQEEMSYSDVPFGEVFTTWDQLFIKDDNDGGTNLVTGQHRYFDTDHRVILIPGRFVVDVG